MPGVEEDRGVAVPRRRGERHAGAGGERRRVEGHATPTGPTNGRIKVKVYVTRRIALTYETTYELRGGNGAPAELKAR